MIIKLPEAEYTSNTSIEESIKNRRSVRDYKSTPISLNELSQLLWAAQGITYKNYLRTAPSAGALYPLEIFIAAGNVTGLKDGIYRYESTRHELLLIQDGDKRNSLCNAALNQSCVRDGAVVIVISAVYERVTGKYMARGEKYVHMEVGHAAQNIYLQAYSLKLGTVILGAFDDKKVQNIIQMKANEKPLCLMPVGKL